MKTKTSSTSKERENRVKVDPELLKQINTVANDEEPVEAVFMLRPDDPSQISASPEHAEELAGQVLQRVEERVGSGANQVNIFRNLGIFAVSAKPDYLRELLKQPEVASAMAHSKKQQAYIPPRDVKPVTPGSSHGWASPEPDKKRQGRSKAARQSSSKTTRKAASSSERSKTGKSNKSNK